MRGKRCPKCGKNTRHNLTISYCKPCWAEYQRVYLEDPTHFAEHAKATKKWVEANRELANERSRKNMAKKYWKDPEESRRKAGLYRKKNHKQVLEYHRKWRLKQKEKK